MASSTWTLVYQTQHPPSKPDDNINSVSPHQTREYRLHLELVATNSQAKACCSVAR